MTDPKQITTNYLEEHKIVQLFQTALNKILEERPKDPFGNLARIFKQYSLPPVISKLQGREVLDSRGNPTVEVDVYVTYQTKEQLAARSSAPSGASTGSNEARELRDKDDPRYKGKGTKTAAQNVTEQLSPALRGFDFTDLSKLDGKIREIDGTELKEKIGGNACTATSFALAEAGAKLAEEELFIYLSRQFFGKPLEKFKLPSPCFNILNGGKHAGGNLQIQEFMLTPARKYKFPDQLRIVAEVYHKLGEILTKTISIDAKNLGDEGGYAPNLNSPGEALDLIQNAVKEAGYVPGEDVFYCLDCASSEFYNSEKKLYEVEKGKFLNGEELISYYQNLVSNYPAIISIEDPFDEKDYETWASYTSQVQIQVVGDDLYTTNPKTIAKGIEGKWANALLLKVNQIGTITEGMEAAKLIFDADQKVMVSHRSGETCNSVIADLAVGIGAQYIKTGSTARGERIQKYTRLLQIYEYLVEKGLLAEE